MAITILDWLNILDRDFLNSISMKSSLNVNLTNYSMSKFSDDNLQAVFDDLSYINKTVVPKVFEHLNGGIGFRVKSRDSVILKIDKYRQNPRKAILCFNDLLGFRIVLDSYPNIDCLPDYFAVQDLRNGKEIDDGYRAIHLYYKLSNYHYPIELQIWERQDELFINWCHKYCYKTEDMRYMKTLRLLFDNGTVSSEEDFLYQLRLQSNREFFTDFYFNERGD